MSVCDSQECICQTQDICTSPLPPSFPDIAHHVFSSKGKDCSSLQWLLNSNFCSVGAASGKKGCNLSWGVALDQFYFKTLIISTKSSTWCCWLRFKFFFLFIYFQSHPRKFSPLSFLDLLEEMRSGWRRISIMAHAGEAGRRVGIAGGCKYRWDESRNNNRQDWNLGQTGGKEEAGLK